MSAISVASTRQSDGTAVGEDDLFNLKVVCVGDYGCGKTSLCTAYTGTELPEDYVGPVFEIFETTAVVRGRTVNVGMWDTAGKEEFDRLRPLSYKQADLFLIVFSVVQPKSFENAQRKWIKEVKFHASDEVAIVMVGTMADMREDGAILRTLRDRGVSPVSYREAEEVAGAIGAQAYVECSAVTLDGVSAAVETAIGVVFRQLDGSAAIPSRLVSLEYSETMSDIETSTPGGVHPFSSKQDIAGDLAKAVAAEAEEGEAAGSGVSLTSLAPMEDEETTGSEAASPEPLVRQDSMYPQVFCSLDFQTTPEAASVDSGAMYPAVVALLGFRVTSAVVQEASQEEEHHRDAGEESEEEAEATAAPALPPEDPVAKPNLGRDEPVQGEGEAGPEDLQATSTTSVPQPEIEPDFTDAPGDLHQGETEEKEQAREKDEKELEGKGGEEMPRFEGKKIPAPQETKDEGLPQAVTSVVARDASEPSTTQATADALATPPASKETVLSSDSGDGAMSGASKPAGCCAVM
uniref:Uncharacterized protein n=1 Tax=Rhizochromulina marina TaxID=1034831 RepID=A0A7S2SCU1_9STRA|mmetsp:Transcript_28376/g.82946  ORF Transcript_28376/g.82946 Transcript_28376/m.82946 type:complete len:520 (+) Transcript_28376:226-1785(+)